jgi:predicted lipoprotein with Yx(FWY)xxD motif
MNSKVGLAVAAGALAVFTLAGCTTTASPSSASSGKPSSVAAKPASITTANSTLGQIVVDGKGLTAYYFDNDVAGSGTSACTGQCATLWPAITSPTTKPSVVGVGGTVATIKDADGGNQITIDGRPIYTFSKDTQAGDVNGEGVGKVWYAVGANGKELTGAVNTGPTTSKY